MDRAGQTRAAPEADTGEARRRSEDDHPPRPRRGAWAVAWWLLLAAAFVAPMDGVRVEPIGGVTDIFLLAGIGVAALRSLVRRGREPLGPVAPVAAAAGTLAVAGLIGTFHSADTVESILNITRFTVATVAFPLAVASLAPRAAEVRQMAWAYVLGSTASALVSMVTVNPVVGRSAGLSSHPNVLGLSAAFTLALLAGLADTATTRARWLAGGCGLALLVGLSRSGSRAAVLGLVVVVGTYLVVTRRHRVALYLAAIVAGAAVVVALGLWVPAPDSALGRVTRPSAGTEQSDEGRAALAATVIERVDRNVLTGSGFSNATEAHNIFIQVVDVGGVLAVVAFTAMATAILRALARGRSDPIVAGALAMYVAYLASGTVSNTLWDRWLWFPIVIGLAAAAATTATAAAPADDAPGGPARGQRRGT